MKNGYEGSFVDEDLQKNIFLDTSFLLLPRPAPGLLLLWRGQDVS